MTIRKKKKSVTLAKQRRVATLRKAVYRGSATRDDEILFSLLSGKKTDTVKRESAEIREQRLSDERWKSQKRRSVETFEETKRRRDAARIRAKLRRRHIETVQDYLHLKECLQALTAYDGGWLPETEEQRTKRLILDRERHQKTNK